MAELIGEALREIRAHPLRSLLTLTGVVFGAASLVSMTSLAAAMKTMAYDELRSMGMPRSFVVMDEGPPSQARRAADLRHPGLRLSDLAALRAVPGVASVHGRTVAGNLLAATPLAQREVRIDGVDAGYLALRNYPIITGRDLAPLDIENRSRVAVLGSELAGDFFGAADPLGRVIEIDRVRFRVVGVVAPMEPQLIPADFTFTARRIYIPYTYLARYRDGGRRVGNAIVTVSEQADFPRVMHAGKTLLRQRHAGVEDFRLANWAAEVAENLELADGILRGWNMVLFTIAAVTLVVGGIGLFSVLLIAVRERVQEIGIRKALGADDGAILKLFLAESLTLAFAGAAAGTLGGTGLIALTEAIALGFGRRFAIPVNPFGVAVAIVFALLVGLLFGWYPARRAAKLDPIEAIAGV